MKTNFEKTAWLRRAEYGFFFHFLHEKDDSPRHDDGLSTVECWNRRVDGFDVRRLAAQLHELHAGFAWITIGQNGGFVCSPNQTFDRIMGWDGANSHCSRRDLVAEFADALSEYGIPLLVYTTSLAPVLDMEVSRRLQSIPPWPAWETCGRFRERRRIATPDRRLQSFLGMWSEIHGEWSARWGRRVHGWWVDGSYYAPEMYDFPDAPNGTSFANSLRSGNPDAVVAFNPGVCYPPVRNYPGSPENMTAGEINEPECGLATGPMIQGLQYHVLSYAGKNWSVGPLRTDGCGLAGMTRNIVDNGGVVSWDIPFRDDGIREDDFAVLKEFARIYQAGKQSFPRTAIRVEPPIRIGAEANITIPGVLEFEMEREAAITLDWNGSRMPLAPCQGRVLLPVPEGKSERLRLSANGFSREFPVFVRRKLRLSRELSEPITLSVAGEELARYRFALASGVFRIEAELEENESCLEEEIWKNSCLELFMRHETRPLRQFCIRHDGYGREAMHGNLFDAPFVAAEARRDQEMLHLSIGIALPEEFRNGGFSFDIQQRLNRAGTALTGVLFGEDPMSVTAEVAPCE